MMKRLISKVLILCMVFSLFSLPASAITPEEQAIIDAMEAMTLLKIDAFIAGVESLENKDEFVNMLVLLRDVDNEKDFAAVYTQMFNALLPGQQDRLTSFGATIEAANAFGNYFMNEDYSISNLEDYLGLGPDETYKPIAFKESLVSRSEEFAIAVKDIDVTNLEAGFARMGKLFGMLSLASTLGDSNYAIEFLNYNFATGVLTQLESEAAILVTAANFMLDDKIESVQNVIDGGQKMVDYINGESPYEPGTLEDIAYNGISEQDKIRILTYLGVYGFVKYPEPTYVVIPGVTTRIVTTGEILEDFEDTIVPLGGGIFSDLINRFSWAQIAIRQLYIAEVIKGKAEGIYDPEGFITRSEFAAMLTRMFEAELPDAFDSSFSDVLSPEWFADEIEAAYRAGYVKGIGGGLYAPYDNISREQIATMIARVLEEHGIVAPAETNYDMILANFVDANEVSPWAKPGAAMCADLELITGRVVDGQNEFDFGEFATRAEIAVILYRIVEKDLIDTEVVVFGSETDVPVQ